MYKIVNRMLAILVLGSISIQIIGMEEKQREKGQEKRAADLVAPLADDAAKRQRVAEELQARFAQAAVANAPERQTFKEERDYDTEVPMQPVITNAQILEMLTGLGTLFDARMSHIQGIMEGKFAENDMKLGALTRAVEEMKRSSLQPGLMPPPAAKAPARARPKQVDWQARLANAELVMPSNGMPADQQEALQAHLQAITERAALAHAGMPLHRRAVHMLPPQLLQAQQERARPLNAAPEMLSNGTSAPQQAALAKLPPQLLQARHAPQSAQPEIQPQNPAATWQKSCTYTEVKDFVAHEGPVIYVYQVNGTTPCTLSSTSDFFKVSDKDGASRGTDQYPCQASCVAGYKPVNGLMYLCIGSIEDYTVKVKLTAGDFKTFAGHTGRVNCIIAWFTVDGKIHILSASADNTIKLWDLENGSLIRTISGHTGSVNALRVATLWCMKCLVSASADMSIKIWDRDGKPLKTISGHEGSVTCLNSIDAGFSRTIIVSGSADGTVRLWDQEGQNLNTILHGDAVHSVKCCYCAPDHQLIVTASQSRIKLWLIKLNLQGHPESVRHLHTINANNDVMRQNNLSEDKVKISAINLVANGPVGEFILTYGTHGGRIKKGVIKIS